MINSMDEMTQETEEINNNVHRKRRTARRIIFVVIVINEIRPNGEQFEKGGRKMNKKRR